MPSLRINDLPEEDRPREKLAKWGPGALSNAELVAIFLRVGVPGKSAIEVAQELLHSHGSLRALGKSHVKQIAQQHGVGPAKAAQIAAAFELGLRSAKEEINSVTLGSPEEIYLLMRPILDHQNCEKLYLLLADSRLKHLRTIELTHGTVNETICHPRDVMHHVVLHQASGFILVHNHPSGDASPSSADHRMTKAIADAAELLRVRFLDHVIIGSPSRVRQPFFSFRENGSLT